MVPGRFFLIQSETWSNRFLVAFEPNKGVDDGGGKGFTAELGTRRDNNNKNRGEDGRKDEWRKADPPEPRLQQQSILGDKQDLCGTEPCVGSPKFLRKTKGGKSDRQRALYWSAGTRYNTAFMLGLRIRLFNESHPAITRPVC